MESITGRVAFVTGASRGIGAAIARSLDQAGVRLGLASRSGDDLGIGGALGIACDVRDPASVRDAVAAVVARFERGVRCTAICPGGVATDFAMGRGRTPEMPQLAGMMSPADVAEAVLYVLTRPRTHRVLEVAFRPVTEPSWG